MHAGLISLHGLRQAICQLVRLRLDVMVVVCLRTSTAGHVRYRKFRKIIQHYITVGKFGVRRETITVVMKKLESLRNGKDVFCRGDAFRLADPRRHAPKDAAQKNQGNDGECDSMYEF